ncbi:hypothetical protein EW026_g521 [Hermanssonia centrifuga]|uniref:Uncharacterized protein n=1 Tax=Hermanssonia centrifuga TaxID=98765 RepID=A0A4S4KV01_9APHY|nr:hypothetical protein EW026_g521 [Hermanssonia centrifuga]
MQPVSDETPHKVPSNAKDNVVEGESLITVNDAKAVATSLEAGNALEGSDVAETPTPASITESPTAAAERQSHRAQMENERRIILERIRERIHSRSSNSPSISIPVITALPSDVTIGMSIL